MEKLSRRDLLSRVGVAAGTVTLAGCAAQPDSQVNQTQTDPPNNRSGPTRGDSLAGAATGGDDLRDLLIKDDNIFEYWGSYDPNEYSLSTPSGGYEAGTSSIYNDWHTGYYVLVMGGYEYEGDGVVFDEDGDGVTGDRHLLAGQSQFGWPGDIPPNDRVIGIGPFPEWDYDDVAWIALEPEFYQIGRWELWLDGSVGNPGYWLGEHS